MPKSQRSLLTKLEKFKNVHPSGVSSSPLPPDMLLLSSLLPLVIISSATKKCCHRPRFTSQFGFAPIASAPPSEAPRGTQFPPPLSKHSFNHSCNCLLTPSRLSLRPPLPGQAASQPSSLTTPLISFSPLLPPSALPHIHRLTIESAWHLTKTSLNHLNADVQDQIL